MLDKLDSADIRSFGPNGCFARMPNIVIMFATREHFGHAHST